MAISIASSKLQSLSSDIRLQAREKAQFAILKSLGEPPTREMFNRHSINKYPPYIRPRLSLCILALIVDWKRSGCTIRLCPPIPPLNVLI